MVFGALCSSDTQLLDIRRRDDICITHTKDGLCSGNEYK